jgi:hypothetical protein
MFCQSWFPDTACFAAVERLFAAADAMDDLVGAVPVDAGGPAVQCQA